MSGGEKEDYEKRRSDAGMETASPVQPPPTQGYYQYPPHGQAEISTAPPAYYDYQDQAHGYPPQGYQYPPQGPQGYHYPPQGYAPHGPQGQMPPYPPGPYQDYYGYGYPPHQQVSSEGVEPAPKVVPDVVLYKATPEQLEEMKNRLRNKYRANMPFDWLGQIDNQWYSSWMLSQPNFVAFRLGLSVFTYYCWSKFHGEVSGIDNWNNIMELLLDSTTPTRFLFVWICLFVVMIGTGGMALISTLQLFLPKEKFAKFTAYRVGLSSAGLWRSWFLFKINSFYDAAPMMSCVPLILHMAPSPFFVNKLALPMWLSFYLPALIMMDWFMTKRTRYDGSSIRRYTYIILVLLAVVCFIWAIIHFIFIRKLLAFVNKNFLKADLAPLIIFYWGYAVITTVGVDVMYIFCRFKADYLLRNHFDQLSSRDVNLMAEELGEHYAKKQEEMRARLEAEQAAAFAEWNATFGQDNIDQTQTEAEPETLDLTLSEKQNVTEEDGNEHNLSSLVDSGYDSERETIPGIPDNIVHAESELVSSSEPEELHSVDLENVQENDQ